MLTVTNSFGYMRTRSVEMMLSTNMLVAGIVLLSPGSTYEVSPIWAGMSKWITEIHLGTWLLAFGFLRWIALIVNGYLRQTPLARIAGCVFGAFFWSALAVSFDVHYGNGIPVLFGFAVVSCGFELYSAYRCGSDASSLDSLGIRERAFLAREQERRNDRTNGAV